MMHMDMASSVEGPLKSCADAAPDTPQAVVLWPLMTVLQAELVVCWARRSPSTQAFPHRHFQPGSDPDTAHTSLLTCH
jgi:hypothetical protein